MTRTIGAGLVSSTGSALASTPALEEVTKCDRANHDPRRECAVVDRVARQLEPGERIYDELFRAAVLVVVRGVPIVRKRAAELGSFETTRQPQVKAETLERHEVDRAGLARLAADAREPAGLVENPPRAASLPGIAFQSPPRRTDS